MTDVYSAVLEIDTRFTQNNEAVMPVQQKITYLRQSLADAVQGFTQLNNGVAPTAAAGDLLIFAAPEYYFAHPQFDGAKSVFAYDLTEAAQADAGCVGASQAFPDILIVPGTVLYKDTVTRAERGQIHHTLQVGKANFLDESAHKAQIAAVQRQIVPKGHGLKSKILRGFRRRRAVGFNQARAYFNGARAFTMNKIENASEFVNEPGGAPILIPGAETGTFNHPGFPAVRMGIEVCADQGRIEAASETVDILILVSAAIGLSSASQPVNARGLAIHANAANFQQRPSGMRRIKPVNNIGQVFDPVTTTQKLLNALTINAVRCQMKVL